MQKRLHEIDGIRGWAALSVLVFHLSWELFGAMFPIYRTSTFKFFLDGRLAVFVFFVLSGDALSNAFVSGVDQALLARQLLKRYFRLAGPILLSCLLAYLLLGGGFVFHGPAARIVGRNDWLGTFLPFQASLPDMLEYALMGVFTEHSNQISYNPFLWPMAVELYGSFLLFGVLFCLDRLRRRAHAVAALAAGLWILGSVYALFFIGLGFAMLRANGFFDRLARSRMRFLAFAGVMLVIVLDAFFDGIHYDSVRSRIEMATVLMFSIYANPNLKAFFSNRVSRFLGRISFPLYVCQFAVLISYTSLMVIYFKVSGTLDLAHSLLIIVSSVLLAVLVAEVFARIETAYLKRLDATVRSWLTTPA